MDENSPANNIMPMIWAVGSGLLAAAMTLVALWSWSNAVDRSVMLAVAGVTLASWVLFALVMMSSLRGPRARPGFLVGGPLMRAILAIPVIVAAALALFALPFLSLDALGFLTMGFTGVGPIVFIMLAIGVPLLGAFFVIGGASLIRSEARTRAAAILGYLEQAVRLNLPLPQMIWAAARSESGPVRWRLQLLHAHLDTGEPIDLAIELSVPEIPLATLNAIRGADRIGRLPHTLARLCRIAAAPEDPSGGRDTFYCAYLPAVLLGTANLLLLEESLLGPRLLAMLRSYHVAAPLPLRWLEMIGDIPLLIFSLVMASVLLLWLIYSYRTTLMRGRRLHWRWGGKVIDRLFWSLPVVGGFQRDQAVAGLCDFLADAIDAGQPFDEALVHAADAQGNSVFRRRVMHWAAALRDGRPIDESARAVGMPELLTGMIAPIRRADELVQVFTWLARYFENRVRRAATLAQSVAVPLSVVLVGGVIAFLAYGIFDAMAILASRVALYW
jgi:type II secretory pathway component PulF